MVPQISRVELDIHLAADWCVDLFLVQCNTPSPVDGPLPDLLAGRRRAFVEALGEWLPKQDSGPANRPCFVVLPELSFPVAHIQALRHLVESANRPAVAIAGLDFLPWETYSDLVQSLPDMDDGVWLQGGGPGHLVNAAFIAVRDAQGIVRCFVQPKRNPSNPEYPKLFPCPSVLVFESSQQQQGRRLNFCVQVCADFTSRQAVLDLRKATEATEGSANIDFTFLLQRNENQFARQFKDGFKAYFEPMPLHADMSSGCLVAVNNASEAWGHTPAWGRSMLVFPLSRRRWHGPAAPTYWLDDDKPHNSQAVVLREPGPGVYSLRYKPHVLVEAVAGTGQPGPFVEGHAEFVRLDESGGFPAEPHFSRIPAVTHWLLSEWALAEPELATRLEDLGVAPPLLDQCESAGRQVGPRWKAILSPNDQEAAKVVRLYFSGFAKEMFGDDARGEPLRWRAAIQDGARRLFDVYTLIATALPDEVEPAPARYRHARVAGGLDLTFIWGGGSLPACRLIALALQARGGSLPPPGSAQLIVVVQCLDEPTQTELDKMVAVAAQDITTPVDLNQPPTSGGDITEPVRPIRPRAFRDGPLWNAAREAKDETTYAEQVAATVLGI